MASGKRGTVTPGLVGQLAEAAGLALARDRQEALVPVLREFLDSMRRLEQVDLSLCEPLVGAWPPARCDER